MYKEVGKVG